MIQLRLSRVLLLFVVLCLALPAGVIAQTPPANSVVTIEPACPVLPPAGAGAKPVEVRVRVTPGAKLADAETLTVELAFGGPNMLGNQRTYPLFRQEGGTWEAKVPYGWNYAIFYVKGTEGRFDNNDGRYWEILTCGEDGTPTHGAVNNRALSYDIGRITPVIQLQPDPARAVGLVEEDLKRHPDRIGHYSNLWGYRAEAEGESDAAYQKIATEIERFAAAHSGDAAAMEIAFQFVMYNRKHFPDELYKKLFDMVVNRDTTSRLAQEAMYQEAQAQKDPQKKIAAYRALIAQFPNHDRTQQAYAETFYVYWHDLKDLAGAEGAFRDWSKFDADRADPYVVMGRFYVEQKTKLDEAGRLLTRGVELCSSDRPNAQPRRGVTASVMVSCWVPTPEMKEVGLPRLERDQGTIRYWRGQARLLLDDAKGAVEDLSIAARILADDPKAAFALGQAQEKLGQTKAAYAAYLDAVTAPYQTSREPTEALERVFVAGGMGTKDELDARIAARVVERRKQTAAEYKPMRLDRPAPPFEFTTLDGKKVNAASLRGRVVVLNFWAVWCGPCVTEMPGFIEFQKRNPNVTLLAVEYDATPEQIKALLERRKLTALNVVMGGKGAVFSQSGLPQTYVLDANGHIQFAHQSRLSDVVAILEKDLAALGGK